jgi:hypothetical protein
VVALLLVAFVVALVGLVVLDAFALACQFGCASRCVFCALQLFFCALVAL